MKNAQRTESEISSGLDALSFGASHPKVPAALTSEMSRLFSSGFSLIPLGGDDGKKPAVRFRDARRLPLATVVNRMAGGGSSTYGIRLDGLLVVDVDSDTPQARAYVERYFGGSPGRTRTSRGYHLFFRFDGVKPGPIRLPDIAIDFKAGSNEFVVGPQSERPDRVIYWPEGRLTTVDALPWFEDRRNPGEDLAAAPPSGSVASPPVAVGSRNDALKRKAAELLLQSASCGDLITALKAFRDHAFDEPASVPDSQIEKLARWYWERREQGEWWGGRNACVVVGRDVAVALSSNGHHLALSLLIFLMGAHGARPRQTFAIDPRALKRAGHFRDGVSQLYNAIGVLTSRGLVELVQHGRGRRSCNQYRLTTREWRERGEASSYIDPQIGDPRDGNDKAA